MQENTDDVIVSTRTATFPSITICPDFHTAYKRGILEKHGLSVEDVRKKIIFPKNLTSNISMTSFFESVTHRWVISMQCTLGPDPDLKLKVSVEFSLCI